MKNLETIANELFNKIRGRYPSITVGDMDATITNAPKEARFFEFNFAKDKKVSISLDEKDLTIMYGQELFDDQDVASKQNWYAFLKELRQFAKKRMLNFDTRDITKSNLDKRDYQTLSTEKQMSESKLYGTSRTSFQDIGSAKMVIKHTGPINVEQAGGRTRDIAGIYIESNAGERFKYPVRHMNGARAMTMHVSEGGNPYDDFGKHIIGLSEELSKLRKFKTYMNRSSVMAEGLAGYMDVVNERIEAVKKTAHALQSKVKYNEAVKNFKNTVLEEVPEDIATDWTAQLTIKQFNEELKDVFPYIYKLVGEANKIDELGPEDIIESVSEDIKVDDKMRGEIQQWNEKFSRYTGMNGDDLPNGLIQAGLNSGILTDMYEKGEVAKFNKMKGYEGPGDSDWVEGDHGEFQDTMPITGGMLSMIADITGEIGFDENAQVVDDVLHGDDPEYGDPVQKEGGMSDVHIDAQEMDKEEFIKTYGKNYASYWDQVHDEIENPQDRIIDMEDDIETQYNNIVNGANFNGPREGNEFADKVTKLKQQGAKPGTKFKTSDGQEHTLKDAIEMVGMDVNDFFSEDELMAEDQEIAERKAVMDFLTKQAGKIGGMLSGTQKQGLANIAKMGADGAKKVAGAGLDVGKKVGGAIVRNPGKTAAIGAGGYVANKVGDVADTVSGGMDAVGDKFSSAADAVKTQANNLGAQYSALGNKVANSVDELKAAAGGALDNLPNMDKIAALAKQHALPAAAVIGVLLGGGLILSKMLGGKDDEKESIGEGHQNQEVMDILKQHPEEYAKLKADEDLMDIYGGDLYNALFDYFSDEMPYGTQKGRDGDPVVYIQDELDSMGLISPDRPGPFDNYNLKPKEDSELARIKQLAGEGPDEPGAKTVDLSPGGKGDEMKQKNEIPLDEFIKSMYDYTQNSFPKGETAVLTAVQKQYGDSMVDEAGAMIQELLSGQNREMARIQHLAGLR